MPLTLKATYDNYPMIGQDISRILMLMNPVEVPILSLLPTPAQAATSIIHEWTEQEMVPDRLTTTTAVNSVAVGATTLIGVNGYGNNMQIGMQVEPESTAGPREVGVINSIVGANTIGLLRGQNGVVNSLATGLKLFVISTMELEGSETSGDVSVPRTRRNNSTQIFKKPITISGSDQSVITAPDIGSEFDHQTTLRTMELARDLEKAIIRGVRINSLGSASAYRSMNGLRASLTTINSSIASNSFAANPVTWINDGMQQAWQAGARDLDVIAVGATWKRQISQANESRLQVEQDERGVERRIDYIETDFGLQRVVLTPWMPDEALMGIATRRIFPMPLRGRSFQREILAKTGDSYKGHVLGEYTMEIHHPDKMYQLYKA